MCEPTHSINQFPDHDNDGNPTASRIDAMPPPLGTADDIWAATRRKIGSWFHFSVMGFGHSEAMATLSAAAWNYLPPVTRYEAMWWNRTVKLDGTYYGPEFDRAYALDGAKQYAHTLSIGNLTKLRQFLTTSMKRSDRPYYYIEAFKQMLTARGRDEFQAKLKRIFKLKNLSSLFSLGDDIRNNLDGTIKTVLGFTRKRLLLVPEWADDSTLWAGA